MFLFSKTKYSQKAAENLMQLMKADIYKLKTLSFIHNVQTAVHLKVNTMLLKLTQENVVAEFIKQMNGILGNSALTPQEEGHFDIFLKSSHLQGNGPILLHLIKEV